MRDRKHCEACKQDLSTTEGIMAWRLHLGSEPIPMQAGCATVDVYVHPHIDKDCYFCGFGCLKKWVDEQ